jgi:hypothetical protein
MRAVMLRSPSLLAAITAVALASFAQAQDKFPEIHFTDDGLELQFVSTLDTKSAADPDNWIVEVNKDPSAKPERLKIKSISIGTDDRTVSLEIDSLKTAAVITVHYSIKSAEGAALKGKVEHARGDDK